MPSTRTVTNRPQPTGSAMVTGQPPAARSGRSRAAGVGERQVEGGGQLPGQPADGQRVAAVRGDRQLDDGVVGADHRPGVGAGRTAIRADHQDAVVLRADAQFPVGADHPVRDPAVGLAGRDRETAGQHGARQRHDDRVADDEIRCAADDPARLVGAVRAVAGADVDRAEPDRLASARSVPRSRAPCRPPVAPVGRRHGVHVLDLEPDAHQRVRDLVGGRAGRQSQRVSAAIPGTVAWLRPPSRTRR